MLEPFCFTGWWGWEGPSVHKLRVCWQSLLGGVILMLVFNAISSSRILDCESLQENVLEVLMKRSLNSWIFVAIFEFWERTNWIPQEPKKQFLVKICPFVCLQELLNDTKTGWPAWYLCDIPQWGVWWCFGPFWSSLRRKRAFSQWRALFELWQ